MEQIKELTKRLIANSFKELMMQVSFEKITIKMITDHANVIRPTFYNHFHDKYELVEWILKDEIINVAEKLMLEGKEEEGVRLIFLKFFEDRGYYRKAFEITGQNGFEITLSVLLSQMLSDIMAKNAKDNAVIPSDVACRYYSSGMITMLKMAIGKDEDAAVEEFMNFYKYVMSHTIYEIF